MQPNQLIPFHFRQPELKLRISEFVAGCIWISDNLLIIITVNMFNQLLGSNHPEVVYEVWLSPYVFIKFNIF